MDNALGLITLTETELVAVKPLSAVATAEKVYAAADKLLTAKVYGGETTLPSESAPWKN